MSKVIELNPWEVYEFPWGSAVKHRCGDWEKIYLKPDGLEIDVRHRPVSLTDFGIEFLRADELYE